MVEDVLAGRMKSPLPEEIGPIRSHWNALCSLDRANLEEASDVWRKMAERKVPKERQVEIMDAVRKDWQVCHVLPIVFF